MDSQFLSRFTPSLMTPDALEAIFIQREPLLQEILERIRQSATSDQKQHTLLVGPRGIGKTHLISLIYYRLQSMEELRDRVVLAWLREEEWGISCFRDLLIRILRALLPQKDREPEDARLNQIYALAPAEAEEASAGLIRELVGGRTLVILAENLDEMLQKLGTSGEIMFHRFLENRFCCMVATSPKSVTRVFPFGSPFHQGFFEIRRLTELTLEDAVHLIARIARYNGNKELASLIATARGRARVRALRYLAGGNHRAYVIFAPLLTRDPISRLIKPLMRTIDDLTPYYNSRIAAMPAEQRKIIEFVCERRHPVRVMDVVRACFVTPDTASAQLEALCEMGHLQSLRLGEARYFELREPLMRLSFEVKKQRGKPIGLLLDFLRLWYSPAELKQNLSTLPRKGALERSDLPNLKLLEQDWEDPRISDCCREYNAAAQTNDHERALRIAEELVSIRGLAEDSIAQASCLIRFGQYDQVVSVCDRMIGLGQEVARAWQMRAWALNQAGRFDEAFSSCDKSIELEPKISRSWCYRASILLSLQRPGEALTSCDKAINLDNSDTLAWTTRGTALAEMERFDDAFVAFSRVVQLEPKSAVARVHLSAALIELKEWDEALKQAAYAIELSPVEAEAWVLHGLALDGMGRHEEALKSFNQAFSSGEESPFVQFKIAELLLAADRWREGAAHLDRTVAQFAHCEHPSAGDTKSLIRRLLPSLFAPKIIQLSIKILLLVYRKNKMLSALAQGLVECIPDIISSRLTDAEASTWRDAWQMMAQSLPEFRLSLRLLNSAVDYRKSQDLSILMGLPQEERSLLEPLVGVHVEAIA